MDEDGEAEEFELVLQPHYGPAETAKGKAAEGTTLLSTETAWLALNPDVFYVDEDEEGNEIWPVTFPATSLENPDIEIEVTLDRDGTLTWPEKAKAKTIDDNQMYYLTPLYMELCDACDDDSVKSAKGKEIATTSTNVPDWFLGLKTLRIDNSGDGDGAAELTLHFQQTDNYNSKFSRNWNYAFDTRKYFTKSNPLGKKHSQNQAADGLWYDGPDVNHPGVDYSFMNMPSSLKFPVKSNEVWYQGELDYFPLLPLTGSYHRLIITEQDKKYNKFSARRTSTRVEDVWTYDMSDGQYDYLTTRIDAASHRRGNSDETMLLSGVRRVNYSTVSYATNSGSVTAQRGGFKYVFVMVHRDIY